jgi:hypothetical protein
VTGIKVADWQNYFPITGSFGGASTGTGLGSSASMFIYNETLGLGQLGYAAYPTTDNQAAIVPGRGYAAFIREGTNPTTLINTGVPTQGNFSFTLTGGGTQSGDGWNLIGNPYASDIVWSNSGWLSSSGVSNIIYVRENLVGGGVQWRTWDRSSSTGNLPNGQIPAGQAFWVQTSIASPTLTVTEAAKSTLSASSNFNFFRSGNDAATNLFSISIDNGTYQDFAYVKLTEDGSDNYNKLKDGFKNKNSFFNISTSSADKVDLAVNDLNNSFCDKTIAINLATISSGSYTLQFNNLDNFSLANIQLIDSLTLTTTNLTSSNPQYTITVSADAASYSNRLFLKLTRPSLITNNTILSDKDIYCRSEQYAIVSIQNSQAGVNYEAINASSFVLSDKVVGTGETIQLLVPIKDLLANQKIQVRSYFTGCSSATLANSKTITISELPSVTAPTEISGCIGGNIDINVTGTGKTYQWFNENANQTLNETGSSLRISVVNPINSYRITAISDKGCKSEPKSFLVRADSLDIPKIILISDGVLETDGTRGVQWLFNESVIPGANAAQYKPEQSGSYSVRTKNIYCVQKSPSIDYIVTGMEGNSNEHFTLVVYPNPSELGGKFTVMGSSPVNNQLQLQVTDLLGKEMIVQSLSLEEYSKGVALETNLSGGVYIIRVTQNGKNVHQKVVIR